jgi:cytochrome c-type biogenesis protein CcmE
LPRNGFYPGAAGSDTNEKSSMNRIHKRRLIFVTLFILGLTIAASLIFYSLKQNMNVFFTPGQLTNVALKPDYHFRLGGMVKKGSVIHDRQGLGVEFVVTDFKREIRVRFEDILPDLFREGKGVIAEGSINDQGIFIASQVLAKHDENYMPQAMYDRIKQP